jgi:hypothetical protein
MSVQKTVTISDTFWQRLLNAPGDVPLDKNQDPVMTQQKYAQKWVFETIRAAVIKAEHVAATLALQKQPVTEEDFSID